jgi:hypothetical protein
MATYKINGVDIEGNLVVVDNTNGVTIGKSGVSTLFNFSNKYKAKIGSSIYSYTNINYKINNIDQGTYISPKINVFSSAGSNQTLTLSAGTKKILCIVLGGGAGGAGGNYFGGSAASGGGGAGGGGGGLAWILYKTNGGETITINVGDGGSGGSEGDPVGSVGTKGGNTSVSINSVTICMGEGGAPSIKSPGNSSNNNAPSTSGPAVSGTYISSSTDPNSLSGGTRSGLVGGDGERDPENDGQRSQNGYGGAGGNGGTTTYPYGIGSTDNNNSSPAQTINPLQFDGVDFLDSGIIMDPNNSTFTYNAFCGKNALVEEQSSNFGQGGPGGNGEGRNSGASQNGFAGSRGFAIIVQYGIL